MALGARWELDERCALRYKSWAPKESGSIGGQFSSFSIICRSDGFEHCVEDTGMVHVSDNA